MDVVASKLLILVSQKALFLELMIEVMDKVFLSIYKLQTTIHLFFDTL